LQNECGTAFAEIVCYGQYGWPCQQKLAYLFWFFQSPTAEMPAWIFMPNTSNDVVLRKEVPFEGYKNEISYLTEVW